MKIFDPKRHLPVGWDWEDLRGTLYWFHGLSTLPVLAFFGRYIDALDALYHTVWISQTETRWELDPNRTIAPFGELMAGLPRLGLWCFLALMGVQIYRHYTYHTRDAMTIYTMRRLPDKWELHRRCLTQPILSILAELLLFAVLTALCWLAYYFWTPVPCRPY